MGLQRYQKRSKKKKRKSSRGTMIMTRFLMRMIYSIQKTGLVIFLEKTTNHQKCRYLLINNLTEDLRSQVTLKVTKTSKWTQMKTTRTKSLKNKRKVRKNQPRAKGKKEKHHSRKKHPLPFTHQLN